VETAEEKRYGLDVLMSHFTKEKQEYLATAFAQTTVLRLRPTQLSGNPRFRRIVLPRLKINEMPRNANAMKSALFLCRKRNTPKSREQRPILGRGKMSEAMTSYERVHRVLHLQPVDLTPIAVSPWGATVQRWREEGHIGPEEDVHEHFGQDLRTGGWINSVANLDFEPITIEETEETILQLDGNGAKLRRHKLHDSTPEHVDFTVKDRRGWEEHIKPFLLDVDRRRIPFEDYRKAKQFAAERQRFFCWGGVAPFEQMHPVCGHEYMLMGMALDPDWIKDMVMTYARFTINHLEVLFAEEGKPDGMFFYEDMGFKHKPFMSPKMYEEIIEPGHKLLFDFAHSQGCKVIVHSCGYVEAACSRADSRRNGLSTGDGSEGGMDLPGCSPIWGSYCFLWRRGCALFDQQ